MIFITRDDVLGYELPIYHIDRTIKEVFSSRLQGLFLSFF